MLRTFRIGSLVQSKNVRNEEILAVISGELLRDVLKCWPW